MSNTATVIGRHRAPEGPDAFWTIASLADLDRTGRHAEPATSCRSHESLRDEVTAVDWFGLGR